MKNHQLKIAFFGSSLVSSYWNGAATYYRGILKALHQQGHDITFYEPDAFGRQQNRDIPDPEYARVVVYEPIEADLLRMLQKTSEADLIIKASGVGVMDAFLEKAVLEVKKHDQMVAFWDVDAPATLSAVENDPGNPFRLLIPEYDIIFTYGGGKPVVNRYKALGALHCKPIYNGLDPDTHHPVNQDHRFDCDLAFLGNRLPDREARVEEFFLKPAQTLSHKKFILGGSGWQDKSLPSNITYLGHVSTNDHNAFNATPIAVMNICRESMAVNGFSPATRVFEAAGAGACIITDYWNGIEQFLHPGKEILVAHDGMDVARILQELSRDKAYEIGQAGLNRVLAEHTYTHRAVEFKSALTSANQVNI
ncbi:MAG: CgeB family protein [Candidatus Cyclobacteriaceae bacterium M3_2C_046]